VSAGSPAANRRPNTLRHALEHAGFRMARKGLSAVPESVADSMGSAVGKAMGGLLRVRRADVDRHLAWAFPDASAEWRRRTAIACYEHFGREAAVLLRAGGWTPEAIRARTTVHGFAPFADAAAAGQGVVLLTGHLGNWEMGGAAIAARGIDLAVVGKGMSNRRFQEDLFATRSRLGMRVIEMGDATKEAPRALAAGRVVAMLGDQQAHRGGVLLPFFGHPASTSRGSALFALRAGAPVFVAFCLRDAGREPRYTLTFAHLVPMVPLAPMAPTSAGRTGDTEGAVIALLTAYGRALEEAIRTAPHQYFWHHRRWKGAN
jgi:KDO2-lipid IV(A) lauroyltransferase